MTDFFEEMLDAADALQEVDTNTTKSLSNLVRQVEELNKDIDMAEQHLKKLKQERHKVQTESIPALMDEMGVDRLDVGDVSVTLKPFISASIPQDRKDEAFAWLRDNNLDDIIKNDVTCSFGKGQDNSAKNVIGILEEAGFDPKTKTHVHPSTLKAFVKERVTEGKPIDLDMFGAFIANAAQIRRKA